MNKSIDYSFCNNISYYFFCIFNQINAALVSRRDLIPKRLTGSVVYNKLQMCPDWLSFLQLSFILCLFRFLSGFPKAFYLHSCVWSTI